MLIHCTTSLSDEDEAALAPFIVTLLASIFDEGALSYAIEIDITDELACRCVRSPQRHGSDPSTTAGRLTPAIETRKFES